MTLGKMLMVLVFFDNFIHLGMINILHGLGLRLLALGHHTPFMVWYHSWYNHTSLLLVCMYVLFSLFLSSFDFADLDLSSAQLSFILNYDHLVS